jgi:hypothetical protein
MGAGSEELLVEKARISSASVGKASDKAGVIVQCTPFTANGKQLAFALA